MIPVLDRQSRVSREAHGIFVFGCDRNDAAKCLVERAAGCPATMMPEQTGGHGASLRCRGIGFGLVQVPAGGKVGEWFKVLRAQRLGDARLFIQPFPEVDHLAAPRTERSKLSLKPVALLLAGRAFDFPR